MRTNTFPSLLALAMFGMAAGSASGATLMTMGFNNAVANIDEAATAGWDGTTTARGGSLASGLTVTTGMKIFGAFQTAGGADIFHVDNWQTDNGTQTTTYVGMTIGVLSGYTFSLGSGSETFSTRLHQHTGGGPGGVTNIFDKVELWVNGSPVNGTAALSQQNYTPNGGIQTLTWNIAANPALNNLTSADFRLYFRGNATGGANNGPEWSLADAAFVSFTGTVVPETSQALLSCLGLALTLVRRKR